MASIITLQNTMNWSKAYLEQQPQEVNGMEPAVSSANLVLQTMLGPPFAWPWNRGVISFTTGQQDNMQSGLSNFGFLEGGSIAPANGNPMALTVRNFLELDTNVARSAFCSPFLDDGAGNITFRLIPTPAAGSVITLYHQKKAPTILSPGSTWAPIPDEKSYIYQWGFLALMSLIGNDARFNEYNQKFIVSLLGAQGGLKELERNIFLANWTRVISQLQSTNLGTAERYKAREA